MQYMIDRRSIVNFDWVTLVLILLLCGIGILNLVSAGGPDYAVHQALCVVLGLAGMVIILLFDYRDYEKAAPFIYVAALGLLVMVHVAGRVVSGSKSWISLGYFNLQPSEPMKVAVILMLARLFQRDETNKPYSLHELWFPGLLVGLPLASILLEPDMGTALTLLALAASMILIIGVKRRTIVALVVVALLAAPPVWVYGLKPHQKERVKTFLQPERDPLGAGYNAFQSKIAIGSGGPWGKGYMKGTQNSLRFLPEQHTDFVFAVWAEEWGFLGVVVLFGIFGLLLYRGIQTAMMAKDKFGGLVAAGCTLLIFWHLAINLAMIGGIFPVIGIPLPFLSYGGSHMITVLAAVGLLLNVRMRRYVF